jgi:hypothetical protein
MSFQASSGFLVPAFVVQRVEVQHVGLPVAGDQVQRAAHAHGLFVEVDGEDLVAHVVLAARGLFLGGEEVALGQALIGMICCHTWKMPCTGKPQLPAAVSIRVSCSCGFIIFTHMSMT